MAQVTLHVYDVTNSPDQKTNENILTINKVFKDYLVVGGIFHGAVEVFGDEWSYGYCPKGTGVFPCTPKENPMYKYRESVVLGPTCKAEGEVRSILKKLQKEWPGTKYDLLKYNCNHFCDELCKQLQVGPMPLWVNRFANMGQTSLELYAQASEQMDQARHSFQQTSQSVYSYFFPQETVTNPAGSGRKDIPRHESLDEQASDKSRPMGMSLPVCPTIDANQK